MPGTQWLRPCYIRSCSSVMYTQFIISLLNTSSEIELISALMTSKDVGLLVPAA